MHTIQCGQEASLSTLKEAEVEGRFSNKAGMRSLATVVRLWVTLMLLQLLSFCPSVRSLEGNPEGMIMSVVKLSMTK